MYLDMNPFSGTWLAKVFSQPQAVFSLCSLFPLLCRSFQFDGVLIVYFGFCFPCFWCQIQSNQCQDQCQGDFFPHVCFQKLHGFKFIFNSLVYFKLNFCEFYKISIQFHSKACVNLVLPRPFISVTIFFALCLGTPVKDESIYMHRFISDSLFCFIHLCVCFSASTILFELLQLYTMFEIGKCYASSFFIFFLKLLL